MVALEEEIGTPIEITGIYFHRGAVGSRQGEFGEFRILMGRCITDSLDVIFDENWLPYTMMEVFSRETVLLDVGAEEWFGFRFDSAFFYDGTYDLLVEVSWIGGSGSLYTYQEEVGEKPLCLQASSALSTTGYWSPVRSQFALEGTLMPEWTEYMDSLAAVGAM